MDSNQCTHSKVKCLNHYEIFRKYLCEDCGGVFICQCEKELALTFLPHQVNSAQEYGTRKQFRVTGFAPKMCAECRGVMETPHPRAAIYWQKGKVERYYWREIYKTYCHNILEWMNQNSEKVKDILEFQKRFPDVAKELEKKAKNHWKTAAKQNPKYDMKETTNAEFLSKVSIPEVQISAEYRQIEKGDQKVGKWVGQDGSIVSVEQIATEHYVSQGYSVLRCERLFISTWVATFLCPSIQDITDPRVRTVFRNSTKGWTSNNRDTGLIGILLPEDFGSAEFYERRKDAILSNIGYFRNANNLLIVFNEFLKPSESLRDYLWVNNNEAVEIAKTALTVLPKEMVISSVEWAIQDFWQRQPGWPDLFIYKNKEYKFVEVKSPYDELSQEQMQWFDWALAHKIPCEILRIKRRKI
ncbi:MAG: VRR-NUC domain-containing protein [Anaerolineaceae bacterium]|nr:MAG: VRR-NUC domain-containing protein [Anaerolineaceae bacterium]